MHVRILGGTQKVKAPEGDSRYPKRNIIPRTETGSSLTSTTRAGSVRFGFKVSLGSVGETSFAASEMPQLWERQTS